MAETLGIENLLEVLEAVHEVRSEWFSFGLALGIDEPTLKSISSACRDNPKSCLRELLSLWLKNFQNPNWDDIVNALRGKIVGHKQVANKIIRSKLCSRMTIDAGVQEVPGPAEIQLTSISDDAVVMDEVASGQDVEGAPILNKYQAITDPLVTEELQMQAFELARLVPKIHKVAYWLETNDGNGHDSTLATGSTLDQLSVITVEDPNTKLNNAVSSTDRALFPQQCIETSNSSSANEDQTSSEIHRLAIDTEKEKRVKLDELKVRRKRTIRTLGMVCVVIFVVIVVVQLLSVLLFSELIAGRGTQSIPTSNEAVFLTRYTTIVRFVESVQFNKQSEIDPNVIDLYAVDCSRLSGFEQKNVKTRGSISRLNHQSTTATNLEILYIEADSTLNISINVTTNDSRLYVPISCNMAVVIFDDNSQYRSFINSGSWSQAYKTICFNDSLPTGILEDVYISQSGNYYITLFIGAGYRVDRVDYEIRGIVVSFDSIPNNCSLQPYDASTCSISMDVYSDQGANDVCFYAVAETDRDLIKETVIEYEPSYTRGLLLFIFLPIILLLGLFIVVCMCCACCCLSFSDSV